MIVEHLKNIAEKVPEPLGRLLAKIPFELRFGYPYINSRRDILRYEASSLEEKEKQLFNRLKNILEYAYCNIPFYNHFYKLNKYSPKYFKKMTDFSDVPIVTKDDLQAYDISERVFKKFAAIKINTGGTSGAPLHFYLDNQAFAREWAHMHYIWERKGYHPSDLKLTFRGNLKKIGENVPLRYNPIHNEYLVNAYISMDVVADAVSNLLRKRKIFWIHGYPSLVAEFANYLRQNCWDTANSLRKTLKGVLLGSEYPAPVYREVIENVLSENIVSWYGHSEMAVLAYETEKGLYKTMPTYGFGEAVANNARSDQYRLLSTSFYNKAHPFVRYDTGDLIGNVSSESGSLSFSVEDGRVGDYILDRNGNKLFLTALIFGRHHDAFEMVNHVQVFQNERGLATLLIVKKDESISDKTIFNSFDLKDVKVDWVFRAISSPIRTTSGKIKLKVDSLFV